ncbi:MAG TPA: hypothetical protein ENO22_14730 [candidate division Zixibacteria bacterium]|nr:hypothetical protein [candidate division Zixibacteria bacterium]
MKKLYIIIPVIILFLLGAIQAKSTEVYFKFQIDSKEMLEKLSRMISIDNVEGLTVYAYANQEELAEFEQYGYGYEILPHPGTLIEPEMSSDKADILEWDVYPTYSGYVSMMNQFALDYPSLCQVHNVGTTVEGRALLFLEISDNVGVEEDEPEVMYSATIHGDETAGYVLMLRLADSLLTAYGTDSLITRLVDSCEIWINPLANPDGTYAGGDNSVYGATRYNANSYDLNRNFPDPEDGPYPGGTRQVETQAMMDFAEAHSFVIGANFHGGAEVVNYPWDTWAALHADNQWYVDISRQFADSAQYYSPSGYLTDLNNGITNGYAWYSISGGRQDYMNYFHDSREVTMEISSTKLLPASQLPAWWGYLRVSLLDWLEQALYGIRGVVTDANTGLPVHAMVRVIGHDSDTDSSMVYTDPEVGDYHRMIEAGTYDLEFSAPGYYIDTIYSITVVNLQTNRVDVAMTPLPNIPLLDYVSHSGGTLDPGDNVVANITLINYGAGIAYNTSGVLSSDDPYITITQSISSYPTIAALGGTAQSNSQYQFDIDSSCPINYLAPFRMDVTADGGYTDSIFFDLMIGQQIEDFESGGFTQYPWVMGGSASWQAVTTNVYEGVYSAKSGTITHNQNSSMELSAEVLSGGEISFYYRVSSESGWDYLRFYIDDVEQQKWSGEDPWAQVSFSVDPGMHTFKWAYTKDGSQSTGSDCAWVDMIVFPPMSIVPEIVTLSLPDWTFGLLYSEQLEATGGTGALTWSDKYDDLEGTGLSLASGGLLSGLPFVTGTITFTAMVTDAASETDEKQFSFEINPVVQIQEDTLPDWTQGRTYSQQLSATGGTGSLVWSDVNSDLDGTGLTLSATGIISGVPSAAGIIHFTARAADAVGADDTQDFEFTVNPSLTIVQDTLPDGKVGEAYSYQLTCTGGTGDKLWSDKYSSLEGSGLTLSEDGLLSGVPLNEGPEGFWAEVQDETGSKTSKLLGMQINPGYICGDANSDQSVNVSDAVTIINYVFVGGSQPDPLASADANCDTTVNVSDAVWIINYVFVGGSAPCDTDGNGEPDC